MRRIAELDGLRGLAAIAIVAYHMFVTQLPLGWAAVDIFFVLSGYLITTIVLEHGRSAGFLPAFYVRRGLRIWPLYYLLLVALAFGWRGEVAAIPYYLTYTQQIPHYWGGRVPGWFGMQHTWTLALEEQFYLVWPAFVLLAGRRRVVPLAMILALISIAARSAGFDQWILAARCDGFALGGMLAGLLADADAERARRRTLRWATCFGLLALLLGIGIGAAWHRIDPGGTEAYRVQVTIASLASFAAVALSVLHAGHRALAPLRSAPLVTLGTVSYGIYILHLPVLKLSDRLAASVGMTPGPIVWGLQGGLIVAVALVSWRWFESPILRLKDRFPYGRAPGEAGGDVRPCALPPEVLVPSQA